MTTYTCQTCGHTAPNYPTSGIVNEQGEHIREDSEQAHARFHAEMTAIRQQMAAEGLIHPSTCVGYGNTPCPDAAEVDEPGRRCLHCGAMHFTGVDLRAT